MKPSINLNQTFDRDLTILLQYLTKTMVTKENIVSYLNTKNRDYFDMTPIEFMVACGANGPRMIINNLVCATYSEKMAS